MSHFRKAGFCFLWMLTIAGCGSGVEKGKVQGVVTLGGEPLDSIRICFMPEPQPKGEQGVSCAITDNQGRYCLAYQGEDGGEGAVLGWHRVTLEDLASESFRGAGSPPAPRIPPRLMTPSGTDLRYRILAGEQRIDIEVSGGSTNQPLAEQVRSDRGSQSGSRVAKLKD